MASTEGPGTGSGQPEWPRPVWPNPEWPGTPATSTGWSSPPPPPPPPPGPPSGPPPAGPPGNEQVGIGPNTRCYEHPDRLASSICRSCNKPICADCMVQAPVGWQCHQCVRKNAKKSPVIRYRPSTGTLPTLSQVPVTMGLIAVCVVVYIVSQNTDLVYRWEQIGGNEYYLGQWYRLFTSIFIHYSFFHILLNMISLLIIGRLVEPALGRWRYLALFLVAGLGGSVACYVFTGPIAQSAGASGAIFGLFGAYFVIARRARADTSGILVLIAINLFYSFVDTSISWQAHIGGLITGVVLAAALGLGRRGRHQVLIDILAVAGVCVLLGLPLLMAPGAVNLG